jgi:thioredoxin reductase
MQMPDPSFTFDGTPIPIKPGASVAAALTDQGHRAFRQSANGNARGIFCGMGVCQDCLVTIDGVPNRRACMSAARDGAKVETQVAFPSLKGAVVAPPPEAARILEPDVAIIGGGAGGLAAAIAARRAGASVVVLDERKVPGGQYYKQSTGLPPIDRQQQEGAELFREALDSGAEIIGSVEVWGAFDGPLFIADLEGRALVVRPRTAIIATGAYERPTVAPGWTLPGVMTTGAAQTLWRSYRTLPGRRIAVCGSGPLNAQVALELADGGAEVSVVAEAAAAPWHHPLAGLRATLLDPGLVRKGLGMLQGLRRHGIPMAYNTRLHRIEEADGALRMVLRDQRGNETSSIVDAICMNIGFEPQNEILRLLGADMAYDKTFGHLRCSRDEGMQTSIPCLYAVGDCTGLGGAPAARLEGEIAGKTAAAQLGCGDAYDLFAQKRSLKRHRLFQKALWQMYDVAPYSLSNMPSETIICRCEEITLGQITEGLSAATGHVGTLKRATRVGMGRCQGRYCGPISTRLVAAATDQPVDDRSHFAPRVPIKPVSIASILAAQEALNESA